MVEPVWQAAHPFSDGLARVRTNARWGFMRLDGQLSLPAIYDRAGDFRRDLALVRRGTQDAYIDSKGTVICLLPEQPNSPDRFPTGDS